MVEDLQGGMGTLPDDVLGSQQKFIKLKEEDIAQDNANMDSLMESWAERNGGETCLVPNNEYIRGVSEPQNTILGKEEIIKRARLMNMCNQPAMKVEQFLSEFIQQGKVSTEEALKIMRERPLHGQLYFDRHAGSCNDLRTAAKNPQAKNAIWVIMAEDCAICKEKNGFCPSIGRLLIESAPESSGGELLKEACKNLTAQGRIMSEVNSWDDLRLALQPQDKEIIQRIYPHVAPSQKTSTSAIRALDKKAMLAEQAQKREENDNDVQRILLAREILPIVRFIGEDLLKGTDSGVVRAETERKFSAESIEGALEYLKTQADPLLLVTHMACYPAFYEGECEKCRAFLRENDIHVANVFPIKKCTDCKWRMNANRSCSLIGAKVLDGRELDMDDVNASIDDLRVKGRLTASQVRDLKAMAGPRERLNKAVRLSMSGSGKKKDSIGAIRENSLILSTASFAGRENAVLWCRENLSSGATISQVREAVARTRNDSDRIMEDALLGMETVRASSIDKCLTENYMFKTGAVLIKAEKCDKNCNNNVDAVGCKKCKLIFAGTSANYGDEIEESPEAREVRDFFADSAMDVQVRPPTEKSGLDIKIDNPGQGLVVDIHKNDEAIDNYEKLFEIAESVIEPDQQRTGAAPLDVTELGNSGFDISALL